MTQMKSKRELLKRLQKQSHTVRQNHVKHCPEKDIRTICECCLNLLKGNIPVSDKQKRALARYKSKLRILAKKGRTLKYKRKVLSQTGKGFWLALLPAAISAITSLFSR